MRLRTVSLFDGEVVVKTPDHASSSQLERWADCRYRWALDQAGLVVPETRGQRVGRAFGRILDAWYALAPASRSAVALGSVADALASTQDAAEAEDIAEPLGRLLDNFYRKCGKDGIVPLATEYQFKVMLPSGEPFVGFIDMLYEEGSSLVVEEWKSSLSRIDRTDYTHRRRQGRDYLWAIRQLPEFLEETDIKLRYLFVDQATALRVTMPPLNIKSWGDNVAALAAERHRLPVVQRLGPHCKWCPYDALCLAHLTGRPIRDIIDSDFSSAAETEEEADG